MAAATYELYPQPVSHPLSCILVGKPERLASAGFVEADCRSLEFASGSFGLGLGAFGEGFADCSGRFGEFLAAAGCAISLPTNEPHALPDFVVEEGGLVPRVETLYALDGFGRFSAMVRFDALPGRSGKDRAFRVGGIAAGAGRLPTPSPSSCLPKRPGWWARPAKIAGRASGFACSSRGA